MSLDFFVEFNVDWFLVVCDWDSLGVSLLAVLGDWCVFDFLDVSRCQLDSFPDWCVLVCCWALDGHSGAVVVLVLNGDLQMADWYDSSVLHAGQAWVRCNIKITSACS